MNTHKFLEFEPSKPGRRIIRDVAVGLMNSFFGMGLSRTKWLTKAPQAATWSYGAGQRRVSKPITLQMIEDRLDRNFFTFEDLDLYNPHCPWLDATVEVGPQFHFVDSDGDTLNFKMPTTLGSSFPLIPTLDREGYAYNSFQLIILRRLIYLRRSLVESSNQYTNSTWFNDLRSLVGECVSLVDVTLHQLYFKAKHSPLPGWRFEPDRLGRRHARRLKDKLAWVYQITGRELNAEAEIRALTEVKEIRNHLQHFDPPCFCYTLEDATRWLNAVTQVASLIWKIRICAGSPLCMPLVELLTSPPVCFIPKDATLRRLPQGPNVGYGSTRGSID